MRYCKPGQPGGPLGPRRIVILRHAETVDNAARIWQGHKDSELSATGRAQVLAAYEKVAPIGGVIRPVDVAAGVLYLCSGVAAAVTGTTLAVAGGEM